MFLTVKQLEILNFVASYKREKGFAPSIREIGSYSRIAPPSVLDPLRAIEKKGFIRRLPFKPRCLEILKDSQGKAA